MDVKQDILDKRAKKVINLLIIYDLYCTDETPILSLLLSYVYIYIYSYHTKLACNFVLLFLKDAHIYVLERRIITLIKKINNV